MTSSAQSTASRSPYSAPGSGRTLQFGFPSGQIPGGQGKRPSTGTSLFHRRDERDYLEFVLDSIERAQNYAGGFYQAFAVSEMAQDAIVWRLGVLADWVANRLSDEAKAGYPGIPWEEITGLETLKADTLDNANIHRVWVIANDYLEPLKRIVHSQLSGIRA